MLCNQQANYENIRIWYGLSRGCGPCAKNGLDLGRPAWGCRSRDEGGEIRGWSRVSQVEKWFEKLGMISEILNSDLSYFRDVWVCKRVLLVVPFPVEGRVLYSIAYVPPYHCQGKPERGLVTRSCDRGCIFCSGKVGSRHNCRLSGYWLGGGFVLYPAGSNRLGHVWASSLWASIVDFALPSGLASQNEVLIPALFVVQIEVIRALGTWPYQARNKNSGVWIFSRVCVFLKIWLKPDYF